MRVLGGAIIEYCTLQIIIKHCSPDWSAAHPACSAGPGRAASCWCPGTLRGWPRTPAGSPPCWCGGRGRAGRGGTPAPGRPPRSWRPTRWRPAAARRPPPGRGRARRAAAAAGAPCPRHSAGRPGPSGLGTRVSGRWVPVRQPFIVSIGLLLSIMSYLPT